MTSDLITYYNSNVPYTFTLTESLDRFSIIKAMDSMYTNSETKAMLRDIIGRLGSDDKLTTQYTRREYGRFKPSTKCSVSLPRRVRSAIVSAYVKDLDIVSCGPSCMLAVCIECGYDPKLYSHISQFAVDKKPYIAALCISKDMLEKHRAASDSQRYDTEYELGKDIFTRFGYGYPDIEILHDGSIADEFRNQWLAMTELIAKEERYKAIFDYAREHRRISNAGRVLRGEQPKADYTDAVGLAHLLQTVETVFVHSFMQDTDIKKCLKTYEYDGLGVRMNDNQLMSIIADINSSDSPIKVINKPRPKSIFEQEEQMINQMDYEEVSTIEPLTQLLDEALLEQTSEPINTDSRPRKLKIKRPRSKCAEDPGEEGEFILERSHKIFGKVRSIMYESDGHCAEMILKYMPDKFVMINSDVYVNANGLLKQMDLSAVVESLYLLHPVSKKDGNIKYDSEYHRSDTRSNAIANRLQKAMSIDQTFHRDAGKLYRRFKDCICFNNGYLNLSTREFSKYKTGDMALQYINLPYTGTFSHETKDKLYNVIFGCLDEPYRSYFLHLLCLAFGGNYHMKKWIILTSVDRNGGKGTIMECLKKLESYFTTINLPLISNGDTDRELGSIMHAGGNSPGIMVSNEANECKGRDAELNGNVIKMIASGGDKIRGRVLYKNSVDWQCMKMLICCLNKVPKVSPSDALQNCIVFDMPYTYEVESNTKEFSTISKSIGYRKADPTIKMWINDQEDLLEALIDLLMDNYKYDGEIPDCSARKASIQSYTVNGLFSERYILDEKGRVLMSDVRDTFSIMHEYCGPGGLVSLGKWLARRGIKKGKMPIRMDDGTVKQENAYIGMAVNPDYIDEAYID